MTRTVTIVAALMTALAVVLVLGAWAARRTHNAADFIVASRRLGLISTALGFGGAAVNAWMLCAVAATAYQVGVSALWLGVGLLLGCAVTLFYLAPRLRIAAAGLNAATITQIVAADAGDRLQPLIVRSAVAITTCLLLLQSVVLLRTGAEGLAVHFGFEASVSLVTCVLVLSLCLFAGGVRTVSAYDVLQTLVMLVLSLVLALLLWTSFDAETPWRELFGAAAAPWRDVFAAKHPVVAIALVGGGFGLGLAMFGQPQALNRLASVRDEAVLRRARWLALSTVSASIAAVLVCGWAARLSLGQLERAEYVLLAVAEQRMPNAAAALVMLALLGAVMLSAAAPLFTLGAGFAADLRRSGAPWSAAWMKAAVVCGAALALVVASSAPASVSEQWLFSVTALGAVFGPLVLVRASGKRIRPGSMLGAMWSAFALTLIFHLLPDSPGDFLQRVLPFVAALGIVLTGGERRRNPDRADRAEETVHDRIPI